MSGAKYLKVSDSIEAIHVPEDLESNETVTFVKKRWPGKQCLVCAVFMIVLVLAIVFLALFVHQLFKSKSFSNLDKEGTRKSGTNCLSSDCVLAAASKFIRQFFDNFFIIIYEQMFCDRNDSLREKKNHVVSVRFLCVKISLLYSMARTKL